jgi:hypothetical protein
MALDRRSRIGLSQSLRAVGLVDETDRQKILRSAIRLNAG